MLKRTIKSKIDEALNNYPVVIISGAKQVGKSTLAYQYVKEKNFSYVSLDNIEQRSLALRDPKYFISQFAFPLIIDEVQYAPILFEVIEEIVNKARLENEYVHGMFLLTVSQVFHLMQGVTQSLAGRAAIIDMLPLSLDEVLGIESVPFIPTNERINQFKDRDINEFINIKDKMKFHDFLQYIASLVSQQVNTVDISKRLGVSHQTINNWLSIY